MIIIINFLGKITKTKGKKRNILLLIMMIMMKCEMGWNILQTRGREKRGCSHQQPHVKEHKKQQSVNKVFDVTEPPRKLCHQQHKQPHRHDTVPRPPRLATTRPPKPVDEDLYKIPPELLRNTKRVRLSLSLYVFVIMIVVPYMFENLNFKLHLSMLGYYINLIFAIRQNFTSVWKHCYLPCI